MHPDEPAVSVLLPVRNLAHTLDECIASIQKQTLRHFEVLAINDHSTDGSRERLQAWAALDKRVRLIDNPGDGLVAALATGLSASRAALVARMDADDRMHPERLWKQLVQMRARPKLALLATAARVFPAARVTDGFREYMRWQNTVLTPQDVHAEIYVEAPFAHPTVMFRAGHVIAAGGYRDGMFPEDYELWLRMHEHGLEMAKLPEILLDWRDSDERASRTDPRNARVAFDVLRAEYLARDPRLIDARASFVVWGAGRRTRKRFGHLRRRGFAPCAWIDIDPRKIGNRVEGVPVVPPQWLARRPRPFVLVYVANHGARDLIGQSLDEMGYRRGEDYLAVG